MGDAAKALGRPRAAETWPAGRRPGPARQRTAGRAAAGDNGGPCRSTRTPMLAGLDRRPSDALHIVGVGGAGMNAIATVLVAMGHRVSGSDQGLARPGAPGGRACALSSATTPPTSGTQTLSPFPAAVTADNVELAEARRRGIPTLSRAGASWPPFAGPGTPGRERDPRQDDDHGHAGRLLVRGGLGPWLLVGGELPGGQGGAIWGSGEWLVVEADESDGTFLHLRAEGVLVTNVEADHLDHYGDVAPGGGLRPVLAQAPGPRVVVRRRPGVRRPWPASSACQGTSVTTYGSTRRPMPGWSTWPWAPPAARSTSCQGAEPWAATDLAVPGLHNVLQRHRPPWPWPWRWRRRAAATAPAEGADSGDGGDRANRVEQMAQAARAALAAFGAWPAAWSTGGKKTGSPTSMITPISPAKVRAVLAAARPGGWERVVAVFQPHRYTRTAAHWQAFGPAFELADMVVVTGVYPAGEAPMAGVDGRLVADAVPPGRRPAGGRSDRGTAGGLRRRAGPQLVALLRRELRPGDLCLTMGAGDLTTLPDELLSGRRPSPCEGQSVERPMGDRRRPR